MKKIIIAATGLILITVAAYLIFPKKSPDKPEDSKIQKTTMERYVAAEGKIKTIPGFEVEVGSELDGRVAEFFFEEGDNVKKGALIAQLENRDIRAKLKEADASLSVARSKYAEIASGSRVEEINRAKASLERAEADRDVAGRDFERYKQLFKEGIISKAEMDERERALKVTDAVVKEAEEGKRLLENGPKKETLRLLEDEVRRAEYAVEYGRTILQKTYITAPISGKVIRKYINKGEMISKEMQTSLVAIADLDKIWINAEVDETDAGKIRTGDPVEIRSDAYPEKVFQGEVAEISDYIGIRNIKPNNPAKNLDMKVIQVKITLKEKDSFKPGMTVDVKIKPKG